MKRLSPHFTLEEFTHSQTAERAGLVNEPGPGELANLQALAIALEHVRALLGGVPMIISSGYRSREVNRMVGGSATSWHMAGLAADFIAPAFGSPFEICQRIQASPLEFEELGLEFSWVHYAIRTTRPGAREVWTKVRRGYSPGLCPDLVAPTGQGVAGGTRGRSATCRGSSLGVRCR